MLSRLSSLPRRRPITVGVGVSTVKTCAADAIAQLYLEKRETLDRRRSAIFAAWGAVYLGGVQYFIYVHLFARVLFPSAAAFVARPVADRLADRAGQLVVLKQVALDQFLHHPFVLFPAFYCVKEGIEKGSFGVGDVQAALAKYRMNLTEDLRVCWQTWIPAFLFNFSVCPLWARGARLAISNSVPSHPPAPLTTSRVRPSARSVPFVAAVSLGFTTYFSFLRGKPQELVEGQSE